MTADDVRLRLVQALDNLLLSFRRQCDDGDPTSSVQMMSMLKASTLGIIASRYDQGVIFGLDICHLNDAMSYLYGASPGGPFDWTLPAGMFPDDWIVSKGTLHNGQKLINMQGANGSPYIHRIQLPSTLRGANFYTAGAVVYNRTSASIVTNLLGGNTPPVMIEKDDVTLYQMLISTLGDNPLDTEFKVQPTSNEILIGRFLADVSSATDEGITSTLYTSGHKRWYPVPSGLPCENYNDLAVLIDSAINTVEQTAFGTTSVYDLMLEICDAGTWGTSFYDYWTTPGRSLPSNVKYYYNELFSPPTIP